MIATVRRLGLVQIDSVNVLVRSHYLPAYSRIGPYDAALLDRAAYGGRRRRLFEYWGHEASLIPVELQPLLRWRMDRARAGVGLWAGVARVGRERAALVEAVLDAVRTRGPLGVSDLEGVGRRSGGWWGWSEGKVALEWLFWTGQVTTHSRRRFERVYDLTERVLPPRVLAAATPTPEEAQRRLLRISSRALGVATARDLRDYFRLPAADAAARISELVDEGALRPVEVEGWKSQAYVDPAADQPRGIAARALLSPFDSLVWERQRTERLFGFRYRLEIYTPARRREHGYYVLPFLLGRSSRRAGRPQGRPAAPHAARRSSALRGWRGAGRRRRPAARGARAACGLARARARRGIAATGIHPGAALTSREVAGRSSGDDDATVADSSSDGSHRPAEDACAGK